jgi:hypothetical protein
MALPVRDHRISLPDAAALTKRYQAANPKGVKAGAFHADQVLAMLKQSGCVGMRVYYGLNSDASSTLVLTAIDSADNDLVNGTLLQIVFPCPPYCGGGNALNR